MEEKTLNLAQCKDYMKNIVELEMSCYRQNRLLRGFNQTAIGVNNKISAVKSERPEFAVKREFGVGDFFGSLFFGGIGAIAGFVIGAIVKIFFGGEWGPHLIRGAIIGGVVVFLFFIYVSISSNRDEIAKEKKRVESIEKYENQILSLQREYDAGKQKLQETKDLLNQYYALGFIYPKYRNLVAMATMYEYLDSQRCYSLIGPDGAYNLYESELRMNTIIGKLDDVISRLDDISEGQRLLAQEIRQSNAKIDSLTRTMDNIEGNTALTAYYSEVTAQNTSYQLLYQGLIEMTR